MERLFKQVGAKLGQANVYLALAGMNDEIRLFEQALKLYEEIGDKYSIARCKCFLGLSHLNAGRKELAVKLLDEALTGWSEINFENGVSLVKQVLSELK